MFCLHICMYTTSIPGTYGGHKRVSHPLEMELQLIVSHYVEDGNGTQVLWTTKHLSIPVRLFLKDMEKGRRKFPYTVIYMHTTKASSF